jgi:hypothetical protein
MDLVNARANFISELIKRWLVIERGDYNIWPSKRNTDRVNFK